MENSKFAAMINKIAAVLNTNDQSFNFGSSQYFQRLNVIRPNINKKLDTHRQVYKLLVEHITGNG